MTTVCTACGLSYEEPESAGPEGFACPFCGERPPEFRLLPLFLVGGPAGAGKSSVLASLLGRFEEAVLIESDLLWRKEFNTPEDGYNDYTRLWLRLAAHIAQSGKPVALFGAGFAVPHGVEPVPERLLFSVVHYLGLTCEDEVLVSRLRARTKWRNTTDELVAEHVKFNHWLKENAAKTSPHVTLLDTTSDSPAETAARVAAWIRERATES